MNIRWRLGVLSVQLLLLGLVSYLITGRLYVADTWFFAGLLAIVINPQLLEPYYSRPADVIANSFTFLLLAAFATKTITKIGWIFIGVGIALAMILSIIALIFGAGKRSGKFSGIASSARTISQLASSRLIYSSVFLLSAIEYRPNLNRQFWILVMCWATILVIGRINWQAVWTSTRGKEEEICTVEGMIGPSSLLVSAPDLPSPGSAVSLQARTMNTIGVVINRIRRRSDTWGQIHISDSAHCESIFTGQTITITPIRSEQGLPIGSVDIGSTNKILRFISIKPLEIGQVVGVPLGNPKPYILYQLSSALIERTDVKGGSHLVVRATANQLGVFDRNSQYFSQHRWVPSPGGPIFDAETLKEQDNINIPDGSILLGSVIGTNIPIFLDCKLACEGHIAILGMTKMGKSTLATRLAQKLSASRQVTILDQTGEYVSKKSFPPYNKAVDLNKPSISVFEPKVGEIPADKALDFLKFLMEKALDEYKSGNPYPRVVIIDEAHQFIPEPAGLGFNAPGRDSSFKIGLLMMQIRKYGISVILISQRTAVVAKSALSQCENLIAFRNVDQTGLDYLEAIVGSEIRSLLPQLRQGEALVFGPAVSAEGAIAIHVTT